MGRLLVSTLGAVALLSPAAPATTWVVNASGGGQFTDIQTAILASQPGDVLLVQPGAYAPFTLDRGLTLIGYGTPSVSGTITIADLPTVETAALVAIEPTRLEIRQCRGPVLVQDLHQLHSILLDRCRDVRLSAIGMSPHSSSNPSAGLFVQRARVELVDCDIRGEDGASCMGIHLAGGNGVECGIGRLHATRSMLHGGTGSSCMQAGFYAGSGGIGLRAGGGSDVILAGDASFSVEGGAQGTNTWYPNCFYYGASGAGAVMQPGCAFRTSGVTFQSPIMLVGQFCSPTLGTTLLYQGGTFTQPTPDDPSLTSFGSVVPGGLVQLLLQGPPGASALLRFGRTAIHALDPGIVIERLTPAALLVTLGTLPAGGTAGFDWHVPASWSPGTKLFAQAELTLPGGEIRRTNSVPFIVR